MSARGRAAARRLAVAAVAVAAVAAAAVGGGAARADGAGARPLQGQARVDWARGLVIATAVGLADRHAPSPEAARGPARRAAEEEARRQLAAAVPALPVAGGGAGAGAGNLGARLADAAVAARVARAIEAALAIEAEPSTDGSWRVTLGLPVEALRQALAGPRAVPAEEAAGEAGEAAAPAVVIVEGVRAAPAIGYTVGGVAGAALWVKAVPAWAKGAPRVKARGAGGGAIQVAGAMPGTAATLFVIATR